MSVKSEIERLQAIKERMRVNLVAQGVTVPEDTVLSQMAEKVLSVAGEDGYTPIKGADYYTEAEKEELLSQLSEQIAGKILAQPEPPEDTSVLWIDTSDENDDDIKEVVDAVIAALPVYNGEVV